jgi:1-acyl-sn-glycerol-3-phosphate acyltransferase
VTERPHGGESACARWSRRALTIPAFLLFGAVAIAAIPVLVPLLFIHDAIRGIRWSGVRSLLALAHYFVGEALGITAGGLLWIAARMAPSRADAWNFRLQCWWASWLFDGTRRLYGLRVRVAGADAVRDGPLLLFVRHASVIDTLLPAVLVSSRTGLQLRYVMKRELLWDPCLDIVGQRLPNAFVRRGQGGAEAEIARVRELARDLGTRDGVMLFPEGTRFTPRKRQEILARLAESAEPEHLERSRALEHVLPPRLGGVLALLEAAPGIDVVFCAHTGFECLRTLNDLWSGALVERTIDVAFWRVPAAAIPVERAARVDWIFDEWTRVDGWLDAFESHPELAPLRRSA